MNSNTHPAKGYYSILQFVPDLECAEGANVGVVLFCPELRFLKARTAKGNDRVRRLLGRDHKIDLQQLNAFKEAFEERVQLEVGRIKSPEDFTLFVDTRANQLLLTEPRPIKVFAPEEGLTKLFNSLVGGRQAGSSETARIQRQLTMQFDELLIESGVAAKVQRNIKIELPLFDRTLTFPFAYSNGQPNVVQTVAFEHLKRENINRACELAVEARDLKDRPEKFALNVLASFREDDRDSQEHVQAVLNKFDVRLWPASEMKRFVEEIARSAH